MPAHVGTVSLSYSGKHTKAGNLTTAVNSFARSESYSMIGGAGVGQVDLIHHGTITLFGGFVQYIDLQNYTDVFNDAGVSFATLRVFAAKNLDDNNFMVNVYGHGSPYRLPWEPTQGGFYILHPGASLLRVSWNTGWIVDANNKDIEFWAPDAGGSGETTSIEYFLMGVSS